MFEPENIRRLSITAEPPPEGVEFNEEDGEFVAAPDYDKLLEIHLRHVAMIAGLFERCGEPLSEEKIAALKNGTWR